MKYLKMKSKGKSGFQNVWEGGTGKEEVEKGGGEGGKTDSYGSGHPFRHPNLDHYPYPSHSRGTLCGCPRGDRLRLRDFSGFAWPPRILFTDCQQQI